MFVQRPAAVAGTFYPADAARLRDLLDRCFATVGPVVPGESPPKALIAPHAGYVYSGPVAAHAHAQLAPWRNRVRRVIVIGPAHRIPVHGLATVSTAAFTTPLGDVPVDAGAVERVLRSPGVHVFDAAHTNEHAIEVQLPFLQTVLGEFSMLPLLAGAVSAPEVADVLQTFVDDAGTVIVVSSDLSHDLTQAQAERTDRDTVAHVLALRSGLDPYRACGATAIDAVIALARKFGWAPRLLARCTSGDTAGDRQRVVGYCAIAFDEVRHAGP